MFRPNRHNCGVFMVRDSLMFLCYHEGVSRIFLLCCFCHDVAIALFLP